MKIGDYIQLIDSDNTGEISKILGKKIVAILDNGFTVQVHISKVEIIDKPEPILKTKKKHRISIPPPRVDLHIDKLIPNFKGMSNAEIILIQIDEFERCLDSAVACGSMFEITFVHGVGAGVLRQEIHKILKNNKQIKSFEDAYFDRGSTLVKII